MEVLWSVGRVRYGAGWGGFSLARPRPYNGPGGYFGGDPRTAPVRGESPLIPWTGPRFPPPVLTGTRLGNGRGRGAGAGNPKKTRPAPGRSAGQGGELGRGPVFFGAPEAP